MTNLLERYFCNINLVLLFYKIVNKKFNIEENVNFDENLYTKFMDCDKIEDILTVRTRRSGDYLLVNHGQSRKKLKEYFIDNKIPAGERDKKLLLADGSHILWVFGHRMSDGCKLSADTRRKVELRWEKNITEEE